MMSLKAVKELAWTLALLAVTGGPSLVLGGRQFQDVVTEDGTYYTMSLYQDNAEGMFDRHYVNMTGTPVHDFLSSHSQAAEAIDPGFHFPFYGHLVESFFVTTHGFLSFAPGLHNLMYKTQYIAPLRVKLDPARYNQSTINYVLTETALTIQWTNVTVAEPYEHPNGGRFTFQVSLYPDGRICFVYVEIPDLLSSDALYDHEPVAGLSDAFLVGDAELHVYHTLNVDNVDIRSDSVVLFHPKPTCVIQRTCGDCLALAETSEFKCSWCPTVQRCSDGADRLREDWDKNKCGDVNTTNSDHCDVFSDGNHVGRRTSMIGASSDNNEVVTSTTSTSSPSSVVSAVISVILVLFLIALLAAFVYVYGRNNPGGIAARFALRLETNYKRFGGGMLSSGDSSGVPVEMGSSAHSKTNPMADINLNNPDENDNNTKVDYSSSKEKNITVNF